LIFKSADYQLPHELFAEYYYRNSMILGFRMIIENIYKHCF